METARSQQHRCTHTSSIAILRWRCTRIYSTTSSIAILRWRCTCKATKQELPPPPAVGVGGGSAVSDTAPACQPRRRRRARGRKEGRRKGRTTTRDDGTRRRQQHAFAERSATEVVDSTARRTHTPTPRTGSSDFKWDASCLTASPCVAALCQRAKSLAFHATHTTRTQTQHTRRARWRFVTTFLPAVVKERRSCSHGRCS